MVSNSPKKEGFRQPAEWERHEACWLAWPSHAELWRDCLEPARREFTALCRAIGAGERLNILVPGDEARTQAARALQGLPVRFHPIPFGDIWLRDTAPIFLKDAAGALATIRFGFNGWGRKYILPHDDGVAARIAEEAALRQFSEPRILEGGSVETDGQGTYLTTRQCLLNPNRNPGMNARDAESLLGEALGAEKVLWLGDGLLNDHTDGHIDTLARFFRPGGVLCMDARDPRDPNGEALARIAAALEGFTDARGRRLEVIRVPSPGEVLDAEGGIMPASYMNFYIGNESVVVPVYGSPRDREALEAIAACFPDRGTIGLPAKAILSGGGAFHCITQQEPAGKRKP